MSKKTSSTPKAAIGNKETAAPDNTKTIIILMIISAVILAIVAGFLIAEKKNWLWMLQDRLSAEKCELTRVEPETVKAEYEELIKLENVTVDQSLMLINSENKLAGDFSADVDEFSDSGVYMNLCIMDAYRALADDIMLRCNKKLYVMSAYRTAEEQQEAIDTEGEKAAAVGESEHQAGLALDVYVSMYAGAGFLNSDAGKAVNSNCEKYGFIIRYPYWGKKATGFGYEPWHIRYVGFPHAGIIMNNRITLEEYIEMLEPGVFYSFGDYIISRQKEGELNVPAKYESMVISPDNTGYLIVTALVGE